MIDRQNIIVAGTDTGIGKTTLAALLTLALDGWYWKPVQSGLDDETDSEAVLRMTGLPADRILPEAYRLTRPLSPNQSAHYDGITIDPARLALPSLPGAALLDGNVEGDSIEYGEGRSIEHREGDSIEYGEGDSIEYREGEHGEGRSIERPYRDRTSQFPVRPDSSLSSSSDSSFIFHTSYLIIEPAGGLMVPLNDNLLQIDLFPLWGAPVVLAVRSTLGTLNHTLLSIEALRARAIPLAGIVLIGPEHRDNMATLERWSDAPIIGTIPHLETLNRETLLDVYAARFLPIDAWSLADER